MKKSSSLFFILICLFSIFQSCTNNNLINTEKQNPQINNQPDVVNTKTLLEPKMICNKNTNAITEINKPYVILVSIDGFRADYIQKYKPKNLLKLIDQGIYTKSMIPSYPTYTFPNHYSIATGRYPGHHGIVSNVFFDTVRNEMYNAFEKSGNDGTWYEGEPLWNVAEKKGMISHTIDWVGSSAKINNMDPTCYTKYDGSIPFSEKINTAIKSLELADFARPHFLTLYSAEVDTTGHASGIGSIEVQRAIKNIDFEMGRLMNFIEQSNLPINLIVVSDHGMANTDIKKIIYLKDYITDLDDPFKMSDRGGASMLYQSDPAKVATAYQQLKANEINFKVYLKGESPVEFHMNHPSRTGDIIIVPDMPYYVQSFRPVQGTKPSLKAGNHGWSFTNSEMHSLFIATGPNIQKDKLVPAFENVDVYPFILEILSLESTQPFDGKLDSLKNYIIK